MTDDLRGRSSAAGLGDLHVPRERVDDLTGEMGPVGGGDRRALVALEIVLDDEFAPVMGQHEIDAGAFELAVEDQIGIGNDERALGHVAVRLRREGLDMHMGRRAGPLAIQRDRGVKFASVIQPGTAKRG